MKLIDLINRMYKRDIEIGFQFTLKYKEFALNTYEIRECEYGLMIWDLDNDSRFDSNEYILDYLDWNVKSIEKDKEIEELEMKTGSLDDKCFLAQYITHNRYKLN